MCSLVFLIQAYHIVRLYSDMYFFLVNIFQSGRIFEMFENVWDSVEKYLLLKKLHFLKPNTPT